jgi:hypothetical protein
VSPQRLSYHHIEQGEAPQPILHPLWLRFSIGLCTLATVLAAIGIWSYLRRDERLARFVFPAQAMLLLFTLIVICYRSWLFGRTPNDPRKLPVAWLLVATCLLCFLPLCGCALFWLSLVD